jgi:hypothetical protein
VNGPHLVILSADVTPDGASTVTYIFSEETGQAIGPMETCEGNFPGYHVVSDHIVVP